MAPPTRTLVPAASTERASVKSAPQSDGTLGGEKAVQTAPGTLKRWRTTLPVDGSMLTTRWVPAKGGSAAGEVRTPMPSAALGPAAPEAIPGQPGGLQRDLLRRDQRAAGAGQGDGRRGRGVGRAVEQVEGELLPVGRPGQVAGALVLLRRVGVERATAGHPGAGQGGDLDATRRRQVGRLTGAGGREVRQQLPVRAHLRVRPRSDLDDRTAGDRHRVDLVALGVRRAHTGEWRRVEVNLPAWRHGEVGQPRRLDADAGGQRADDGPGPGVDDDHPIRRLPTHDVSGCPGRERPFRRRSSSARGGTRRPTIRLRVGRRRDQRGADDDDEPSDAAPAPPPPRLFEQDLGRRGRSVGERGG